MRISDQPSQVQVKVDQNQMGNVKYFSYLGSMITNDANVHVIPNHVLMCVMYYHGKYTYSIQREDSLRQQIGLKFKQETSKMLHL